MPTRYKREFKIVRLTIDGRNGFYLSEVKGELLRIQHYGYSFFIHKISGEIEPARRWTISELTTGLLVVQGKTKDASLLKLQNTVLASPEYEFRKLIEINQKKYGINNKL